MIIAYGWILTSTVFFERATTGDEPEGQSYADMVKNHPFIKYLPACLEFTTITLIATFALLNVVPSKIRKFTGSWPLDERHITPSYSAKRKVRELGMLLELTEKHSNFMVFKIPAPLVPVFAIIYFFFKSAAETSVAIAYIAMILLSFFVLSVLYFFVKNVGNQACGVQLRRRRAMEVIFRDAIESDDRDELNYIIKNIKLPAILVESPSSTVRLFSSPAALKAMSTVSKAIVIDALQKRGASGVQTHISEIIFSTKGRKLTKLKNIIDTGSDYHNMLKLVQDVTDYHLREDLLQHIAAQAKVTVDENGGHKVGTKTLCDVDDTLHCSGGRFPVGVDKRLPRRCLYPGVFKFLECIDKVGNLDGAELVTVSLEPVDKTQSGRYSAGGNDLAMTSMAAGRNSEDTLTAPLEHIASTMPVLRLRRGLDGQDTVRSKKTFLLSDPSSCNLVFLSARPHLYKELTEQKSYRRFRHFVSDGLLHKMPTLLPGKLFPGTKAFLLSPFIKSRSWRWVGDLKFASFRSYSQIYPEYDYVFIGDNGQGDLYASELMEEYANSTGDCDLRAVYIHQVQEKEKELHSRHGRSSLDTPNTLQRSFYTYVGAALNAARADLLNSDDVYNITIAALDDFDDLRALYPSHDFKTMSEQLQIDTGEVNAYLNSTGHSYAQLGVRSIGHLQTMMSNRSGGRSTGSRDRDGRNGLEASLLGVV
ncbi:hypothetical protein TrVE_jg1835 [Triparma verrucosa]|uniref:Phosphatidate phosphatase APP1 catalytic domain-containing protein n=1 Tax=Triparma verrucosa TaxID=1606542 RepID=A0A9W7C0E6_9STRA|nr:hypothetical protein TrVE_jg1835 [Triparma verrucosa]|eukprot:CAMPEP_0182505102 /NCGR_PEP_ID=MMETSP1321-20130603/18469_1 /TAXON_ID=91990 /ORGANISM="Bolidomonas sp., Strain RCC1657" /LENGTH=704 /DNA_ID=CAMNT_0024710573 /DNA_START=297 /DNA_END=2408 /DNA_ORIENTATION=-